LNIKVKPAADLSKLEEVLVLVENREKEALAQDAPRVRAADILAQRLPSVPEKPADAKPPGAAEGGTTSTGVKPATQVKPEVKPQTGAAVKPQSPTGAAKPAATTAGTGAAVPVPASKLTNVSTAAQKKAVVTTGAATGSITDLPVKVPAQPKPTPVNPVTADPNTAGPNSADPKSADPSAPPSKPQTTPDESSPQ
jgi:hypothetical protein